MNEQKFRGFFNGIKTLDNVNLIFVDASHKLKKVGYESWYSSIVDSSNGIWVGPGFIEQTVIKTTGYDNVYKKKVNNQFAWVSRNGDVELIKIVGEGIDEK